MPHLEQELTTSLTNINNSLIDLCASKSKLAEKICKHLLSLSSKRLRAKLTLLSTCICNQPMHTGEKLATIVEWLHAATLLHDDVIDNAELRRYKKSANKIWDNSASILSGDYLYAIAFKNIASIKNHDITETIANATTSIIEGEMNQLSHRHGLYTDIEQYISIIGSKTAELFAVAAELPAINAKINELDRNNLRSFGYLFGLCYQIIDDINDYTNKSSILGKTRYQDLKDGTCTLPLIIAANSAPNEIKTLISKALKGCLESQNLCIDFLQQDTSYLTKSIDYAKNIAAQATAKLSSLPDTPAKKHLLNLLNSAFATNSFIKSHKIVDTNQRQ